MTKATMQNVLALLQYLIQRRLNTNSQRRADRSAIVQTELGAEDRVDSVERRRY